MRNSTDKKLFSNPGVIKWALYDWANSAFSTTVIAGFFPIFFKEFWCKDLPASVSTSYLGLANSIAGVALVLLSPWLGLYATSPNRKKSGLILFSFFGILCTFALYFVGAGEALTAATLFSLGLLGFTGSFVFYDSLLTDVAHRDDYDQASSYGYALGYLGGGILFLLNAIMVTSPTWFGLASKIEAVQLSFLTVGLWWLVFSLPLYFAGPKDFQFAEKVKNDSHSFGELSQQFKNTAQKIWAQKSLFYFILAYFFYIEAVNTVMKMAVDYGLSIGFDSAGLIQALLMAQFVGFPFALLFGWIGKKLGALTGVFICLVVYLLNSIYAQHITADYEFYIMAAAIASVQGGIQALSRSHFASLVPHHEAGPYFGFFNMLGRFSSIIGPTLIGVVSVMTGSARSSLFVVIGFLGIGLIFLNFHYQATKSQKANGL